MMKILIPVVGWWLVLGLFCQLLHAATIRVPQDQATIQAAIDATVDGDTIKISSGVYRVNLRLEKDVNLVGSSKGETVLTASQGTILQISKRKVREIRIEGIAGVY